MKCARRVLLGLLISQLLAGFWFVPARSQSVDPTKALIGTWEGWVAGIPNPERVLVIRSVKAKDGGGWVGDGRYGYTVEKTGRSPIEISQQDADLILEFTSGEKIQSGSNLSETTSLKARQTMW